MLIPKERRPSCGTTFANRGAEATSKIFDQHSLLPERGLQAVPALRRDPPPRRDILYSQVPQRLLQQDASDPALRMRAGASHYLAGGAKVPLRVPRDNPTG